MVYVLVIVAIIAAYYLLRWMIVKVQGRILIAETEYMLHDQYRY